MDNLGSSRSYSCRYYAKDLSLNIFRFTQARELQAPENDCTSLAASVSADHGHHGRRCRAVLVGGVDRPGTTSQQ